jgi:hypothetical protein
VRIDADDRSSPETPSVPGPTRTSTTDVGVARVSIDRAGAFLTAAVMSLFVLLVAALLGDDEDDDQEAWDADGELVAEGFSR